MPRAPHVLVVEDDPGDVLLVWEALEASNLQARLSVVADGAEALAYLRGAGRQDDTGLPDLILLDLNLPGATGHEVLAEIKDDPMLRTIPTVVLSTSAASEDVARSYELHANMYVTKPGDFDEFIDAVKKINDFFLETAQLPDADVC